MDAKKVLDKMDLLGALDDLSKKFEAKFQSSVIGKAVAKMDEFLSMDKFGGISDDIYEAIKEQVELLKQVAELMVSIVRKIINQIKEFIAALLDFIPGL